MPILVPVLTSAFVPPSGSVQLVTFSLTEAGARQTTVSASLPGSKLSGDLLIVVAAGYGSPSTPSGWTKRSAADISGSPIKMAVFTRQVDGTESSVSVTFGTSDKHVLFLFLVRGGAYGTSSSASSNSPSSNMVVPPTTTSSANNLVLHVVHTYVTTPNHTTLFTWPSPTVELFDRVSSFDDNYGNYNADGIAQQIKAAAGSVPSLTVSAAAPGYFGSSSIVLSPL